jgi:pimeloyl-ACP methyl ester carboxylesterase
LRRRLLAGAALLGVAAVGLCLARYPERRGLDPAARRDADGQFVPLSDGVTHYELSGPKEGPPVVLVHGFSVPYYVWDPTAQTLRTNGYRVLRYDLYGRGYSDRPPVDYTADLFDRQLLELMHAVGMRAPVHLMGVSMGGWVSATFTGRHPQLVRSLTLIDPIASRPEIPWVLRLPAVGPLLFQVVLEPGMPARQTADFLQPARFPDWPARYGPQMQFRGFGRALRSTALALASVDFDRVYRRVAEVGCPVLLLWGREDKTVPFALNETVRRAIPAAEFHAIDGAAHLPHLERADAVDPLLLDFLAKTAGRYSSR